MTKRLILASKSPRRNDLLKKMGWEFEVRVVDTDETLDEQLPVEEQIKQIAFHKAEAVAQILLEELEDKNNCLILAADTAVVIGTRILGKPRDIQEARLFLTLLSGITHKVITAVSFYDLAAGNHVERVETSLVTFRTLSQLDIESYLQTGECYDKAGAYGIQGAASKFIVSLNGSIENVIGLPIELVEKMVNEFGWNINRR